MNRETHLIVEIGPGPGGLTRELLNLQLGDILAVEKDKGFRAALEVKHGLIMISMCDVTLH